jgi:hypothetical protein
MCRLAPLHFSYSTAVFVFNVIILSIDFCVTAACMCASNFFNTPPVCQRNTLARQATNPIPTYTVPPVGCTRGLDPAPYQNMWACGTCKLGRHSLFCEACAAQCHGGHELLAKGPQVAPCVCAEATDRCVRSRGGAITGT